MNLKTAIDETKEYLELNYDYDDDESPTDDDAMEHLIGECGKDRSGYCSMAGSEYCDFECPFS